MYRANIPTNIYPIKLLKPNTTYYWKIIAKDADKTYESPVWSFKTRNFSNGELIWVSFIGNNREILYSKNIIFNIYQDTIEAYNEKKDLIYKITDTFFDVALNENYIYLLQKNEIKLYTLNDGIYKESIPIDKTYTHIKLINNYILLYSDNTLDIYNLKDKIISLNFNEKIKDVYTFKNAFVVDLENKISIMDYSGKILKNFKIAADIIDLNNNYMLLKIKNILYLFLYNGQMFKIDEDFKHAFLYGKNVYIVKNKKIIIYNIPTKNKKILETSFGFNNLIITENKLILIGEKVLAIDLNGNVLWKHEFQNDKLSSNIVITDYNTFIFSLFDGKYYKIVEIYDKDIFHKNKNESLFFDNQKNMEYIDHEKNISILPTPVIINPKFDEKIQDFNASLEWVLPDYESTTVTYEIQLKEISSGLIKTKKISNIAINKINLQLEPNTKYIWKVIAKDKNQTKESKWYVFSTDNLDFVLKRINLIGNQMILKSKIKNDYIYFTGYTITPEKDTLKLLYGKILTNFFNLKAWDFGSTQDKYGSSIDITNDGTVIIGGFSSEKDPRGDMLLYSLSENGKIYWEITNGSSKRDSINNLFFDNTDGYIYTLGTIGTDNMGTNIQFSKYSSKGYRIWYREFGGYDLEFGSSLKRIDRYSFLLLGSTKSFGKGGYDYYIIKTNELGKKLWDLTSGTSKDDFASDLLILSRNEYIIIGTSFRDTLQPFISKIDGNGFKIFEKLIPFPDDVNLIRSTLYKNYIYCVGWTREKSTLKRKGIITKFDLNGNLLWAKTFQIEDQDTMFTDIIIQDNKFFLFGISEYPKPNSRDIIIIQTSENYILKNFNN
ncbi:hypothetical protein [Marinitoga hydrogenitolerans]|uniref:hypothetical protein n=1 Tax=Marinitoga hydrogenitolerans TaxID=287990 RepID=UPI0011609AE1|nr:hypothetical protein [Marinitoga hydrogenitolerans]